MTGWTITGKIFTCDSRILRAS